MTHLTSHDRRLLREYLNKYIQDSAGSGIKIKAYARAVQWSEGMSFTEIAQEEGISVQAASQQVQRVIEKVRAFVSTSATMGG